MDLPSAGSPAMAQGLNQASAATPAASPAAPANTQANTYIPFGIAPSGQNIRQSTTPPIQPSSTGYGLESRPTSQGGQAQGNASDQAQPTGSASQPASNQAQGTQPACNPTQGQQPACNPTQDQQPASNQAPANNQQGQQPAGNQAQGDAAPQGVGLLQNQQPDPAQQSAQQPDQQPDPDHQPITDFAKVDLGLGDAPADPKLLQAYGSLCTEHGLTPAQARALAQWQVQAIKEAKATHFNAELTKLKSLWGKDFSANANRVNALCARLSQQPGLASFTDELSASGAADNAMICQALLSIANMLAEDSTGHIASAAARPETALEGLQDVWRKAQGR